MRHIGVDAGNGAFKLYGNAGGQELVSQVATNYGQRILNDIGLRKSRAPLGIKNDHGSFYVGARAHDYGRPVENLDAERFNGTPEMRALLHGSLTMYQQRHGKIDTPVSMLVGLPNDVFAGNQAEQNIENVKRWMRGAHSWAADGENYNVEIAEVKVARQVTGGLFDYLLDTNGKFVTERKKAFIGEVGIISVGFGTVELMVVQNREIAPGLTSGAASGVRRLLEILNGQRLYSLGELDNLLRAGKLDTREALPIWESEVTGVIERQWGAAWKRFAAVLIMGGGAILLRNTLPHRFNGKAFVPDEPVQAIARGLYKMGMLKKERE